MKKIIFDVQMFGEGEGTFNASAYNTMVSDYEADIPQVGQTFQQNQDALRVFRAVAASPRLNQETKSIINGLNESIDKTADYFDSVKAWASGVVDAVASVLKFFGMSQIGATLDRTVLDDIKTELDSGSIGIENFSDASTYIDSISTVSTNLKQNLEKITSDVDSAKGSLPQQVHNSLARTISTNNDDVVEGYNRLNEYLSTNVEKFTSDLQSAIDDLANAASGSGN